MAEKKRSTKILPGGMLGHALDALDTRDASLVDNNIKGNEGRNPGLPKLGRMGSANFYPVDVVSGAVRAKLTGDTLRFRQRLDDLEDYYTRMGPTGDIGHDGYEGLSTTYGEAHLAAGLMAFALGVEAAGPYLERSLALCLLHRCPNGRIVSASTRAGKIREPARPAAPGPQWAREEFVRVALKGNDGRGGKLSLIMRAFTLPGGWQPPGWILTSAVGLAMRTGVDRLVKADERLGVLLDSIRFASGPLIVTHHERGHVSHFETGPICYASPVPAAVVSYDSWRVQYVSFPGASAKPFTELRTRIYETEFTNPVRRLLTVGRVVGRVEELLWELDLSELGPVVAEHRFEEVKK